jgi:uncharacterized Zn finger protein (UPF0148 family)
MIKRADDEKPETNRDALKAQHERGVYFWRVDGAQCCSHITKLTPLSCERHAVAFDTVCPSCRAQGMTGKKDAKQMPLEVKVTEREIKFELSDEEREARRASFEQAWEKEQDVKARKAVEVQGFNAELKDLRAMQKALHDAFTSGKETRLIDVYERPVERLGNVELVEKATGKVVDTRPMTPEERQQKMFGDDGVPAVKAKGNGKSNGKGALHADELDLEPRPKPAAKRGRPPKLTPEPLKAKLGEVAQAKAKRAKRKGRSSEARA